MKVDKTNSFAIIMTLVMSLFVTSCSNDEPNGIIYDFVPIIFKIDIQDNSGNIQDHESEAWTNLLGNTSVEYDGKVYTPREDTGRPLDYDNLPQSRYYPHFFKGLIYSPVTEDCSLYFGEFARDESYIMEFKINWPDGTSSDVKFENKFWWKKKEPKISSKLWIDGREQENSFVIYHKNIQKS